MRFSRHCGIVLTFSFWPAFLLSPTRALTTTLSDSPIGANTPPCPTFESATTDPRTAIGLATGDGDPILIDEGRYDYDILGIVAPGTSGTLGAVLLAHQKPPTVIRQENQ